MASWSQSHVAEFIEIYRSEECLWKIKSPLYSNRLYKQRAYHKLLEFVLTFDRDATKDSIIKKINTIRSSFRKEFKKVKYSSLSGSGADEVYKPKLWYYKDLLFLQDQEQTRITCSSLDNSNSQVQDTTLNQDTCEDGISVAESADDLPENIDVADSGPTPTPTPTPEPRPEAKTEPRPGQSNIPRNRTRSKRKSDDDDELLKAARKRLLSAAMPKEDQFDAYGKLMAHKMRNLSHDQRVIAERLCHDVMLDAELGILTRQRIVNQPTYYEAQHSNLSPVFSGQVNPEVYRSYHYST